jgi:hypothetical protein
VLVAWFRVTFGARLGMPFARVLKRSRLFESTVPTLLQENSPVLL